MEPYKSIRTHGNTASATAFALRLRALVAAVLFALLAASDRETANLFGTIIEQGPDAIATLAPARQAVVQAEIADAFRTAFTTIAIFTAAGAALAWSLPLRWI